MERRGPDLLGIASCKPDSRPTPLLDTFLLCQSVLKKVPDKRGQVMTTQGCMADIVKALPLDFK